MKNFNIILLTILIFVIAFILVGTFLSADPYLGPPQFSEVNSTWETRSPFSITACYYENGNIYIELKKSDTDNYAYNDFILDKFNGMSIEGATNMGGTVGKDMQRGDTATVKVLECENKYKRFTLNDALFEFRYYSEHYIPEEQFENDPDFVCYCN